MATTTIAVDVPSDEWTEIVDGDDYESVGLQVTSVQGAAIAIAATEPAADSADFVIVGASALSLFVPIALAAGDLIYARGINGEATIRLYQVERAA